MSIKRSFFKALFFFLLLSQSSLALSTDLFGNVVIITGGASGIGEATALLFSKLNARAIIVDQNAEKGRELVQRIHQNGHEALFIETDLTDDSQCKAAILKTIDVYGHIDILVNNAGTNDAVGLDKSSNEFEKSLKKNLIHYFTMAHYALPYLKETFGTIINVSSKVALTGQGNTSGYVASKGGVLALTREWAAEFAASGIRVNAVVPAEVATPQYQSWIQTFDDPKAKLEEIEKSIPLSNRLTKPEEIAKAIVALASDLFSHTTGQWIFVDGGVVHLKPFRSKI